MQTVVVDLLVQGVTVDSQTAGSLRLGALKGSQDLQNEFLFDQPHHLFVGLAFFLDS